MRLFHFSIIYYYYAFMQIRTENERIYARKAAIRVIDYGMIIPSTETFYVSVCNCF